MSSTLTAEELLRLRDQPIAIRGFAPPSQWKLGVGGSRFRNGSRRHGHDPRVLKAFRNVMYPRTLGQNRETNSLFIVTTATSDECHLSECFHRSATGRSRSASAEGGV